MPAGNCIMNRHLKQPVGGCTMLDEYISDLNLEISSDKYSCKPMTLDGFAYMWAGAKANFGLRSGKVCYEVKITEHLEVSTTDFSDTHVVRVGWSTDSANLQLGEDKNSFGFGGTAKKSEGRKFSDYGRRFGKGDVISCYLMIENGWADISYCINGRQCGSAFKIRWQTNEALFPHILTKNCSLELNFGQASNPYFSLQPGYKLIDHIPAALKVPAISPPCRKFECEVIMMVGLPGVGKTTWAMNYTKIHPSKKYNILGTDAIIDKMRILGLPRKNNFGGRWDVLIKQATECFNVLLKKASGSNRNVILDQTNVYASARKRKANQYKDTGYMVHAMVLVPSDSDMIRRSNQRTIEEGKEIPQAAVLDMKANFSLPHENEQLFSSITFLELQREEAEQLVLQYNAEANLKGHISNKKSGVGFNQNQQEKIESSPYQSSHQHSKLNSRDERRRDSSRSNDRSSEKRRSQVDEGSEKNRKSSRSQNESQNRSDSGSRYEPADKYRRNNSSSPCSNSPSRVSRDRYDNSNFNRGRSPSQQLRHGNQRQQHHQEKNFRQERGRSFEKKSDSGSNFIRRKDFRDHPRSLVDSPTQLSSNFSKSDSSTYDVSEKTVSRPRNNKPQNQAFMNQAGDVAQQHRFEFSHSQNTDIDEQQNFHDGNLNYSENYENRYESSGNDYWSEPNQEWTIGQNQHNISKNFSSENGDNHRDEQFESWDGQNMQRSHGYFDTHDHPVENNPEDIWQHRGEFTSQKGYSSVNWDNSEGGGNMLDCPKFNKLDSTSNPQLEPQKFSIPPSMTSRNIPSLADYNFQADRNVNVNSPSAEPWNNSGVISQRNMSYNTQGIDSWKTQVNKKPTGDNHFENQDFFPVKQKSDKVDHSLEYFNPAQIQRETLSALPPRNHNESQTKWGDNSLDCGKEGPESEQHDAPLPEISNVDFNKLKASLANIRRNSQISQFEQNRFNQDCGSEDYFSGGQDSANSSVNFGRDITGNIDIHGPVSGFEQFSDESYWHNTTEDLYDDSTMQDTVQKHHPLRPNNPSSQRAVIPLRSAALPHGVRPSFRAGPRGVDNINSRLAFPRIPRLSGPNPNRARPPLLDTPPRKLRITENDLAYQPQDFDENAQTDSQPVQIVPRTNLPRNSNPQNFQTHSPSGPRFRLPAPRPRMTPPTQKQSQWNQPRMSLAVQQNRFPQRQRAPTPRMASPSRQQLRQKSPATQSRMVSPGQQQFQQRQRAPDGKPRMTSASQQHFRQRPPITQSRMVSVGQQQFQAIQSPPSSQQRMSSPGQLEQFQQSQRPSAPRPRMPSQNPQQQFQQGQRPPTQPTFRMPSNQQQQISFQQRQRSLTPRPRIPTPDQQQYQKGQNEANLNAPRKSLLNAMPNANTNRHSMRMDQPRRGFMRNPSRGMRPPRFLPASRLLRPGPRPTFRHSGGAMRPRNFRPPFPPRNY